MARGLTAADLMERVRNRRRRKRCPDCNSLVSIRGFDGAYRWTCSGCEAIGIGYASRSAALEDLRRRRE